MECERELKEREYKDNRIMREKRGSRRLRQREDTDYDKEEETEYENRRTSYHENNRNKSKSEIEKEERGTNVRSRIMPWLWRSNQSIHTHVEENLFPILMMLLLEDET